MPKQLTDVNNIENKVRKVLIKVARGNMNTYYFRKITYKELWLTQYPTRDFGQGNTKEVVNWIVNISDVDIKNKLPPLNALVVRKDTSEPGDNWASWHKSIGCPFESLSHAQSACWAYWPTSKVVEMYHR